MTPVFTASSTCEVIASTTNCVYDYTDTTFVLLGIMVVLAGILTMHIVDTVIEVTTW